jgi:hypothetical protein
VQYSAINVALRKAFGQRIQCDESCHAKQG